MAQGLDGVPLTDESETMVVATLQDGQEVEVVGWRQRPRVRYHIRCLGDDSMGWVWAEFLRPTREPVPVSEAEDAAAAAPAGGRRGRARAPRRSAPPSDAAAMPQGGLHREQPMACTVCGETVHPYNLWRNAAGKIVGCFLCQGKKS